MVQAPGSPHCGDPGLNQGEAAAQLRDPAEVLAYWDGATHLAPAHLQVRPDPNWWALLEQLGITLLVTREYEHLVLALSVIAGRPRLSYIRLPHPSGLVVDRQRGLIQVAATRNPNQVVTLAPIQSSTPEGPGDPVLSPIRTIFLPGALYLHDLALIGGRLHGNAVGRNAIAELHPDGPARLVWWPRVMDEMGEKRFAKNYLQLNSIAAGEDLDHSFFAASTPVPGRRRPGHLDFKVDRAGVIFSGHDREVMTTGLTRPHSTRFFGPDLWVDNSGYGEVGPIEAGRFTPAARLPGWTRGLCFIENVAFVGTSRVIPKYRRYAPGVTREICAVHALDCRTGETMASVTFPAGNQIFAIDWCHSSIAVGLPFETAAPLVRVARARRLFYDFHTSRSVQCPD